MLANILAHRDVIAAFNPILWKRSDALGTAPNTKTALAGVTENAAPAPDGSRGACLVIEDGSTTYHYLYCATGYSYDGASAYVVSVYAKRRNRTWLFLQLPANKFGLAAFGYYNLSAGALGTVTGATGSILSAGGGWWRCSLSAVSTVAGANNGGLRLALAAGDGAGSYNGDGVSGIYLWRAQLEKAAAVSEAMPTALIDGTYTTVVLSRGGLSRCYVGGLLVSGGNAYPIIAAGRSWVRVAGDATGLGGAALVFIYPPGKGPADVR